MGWTIREANHCLNNPPCDEPGLVAPVVEYAHDGQASAVVGGFVYHGLRLPALAGRYVYADYSRGDVWPSSRGQARARSPAPAAASPRSPRSQTASC
jgi:hypothetical protein